MYIWHIIGTLSAETYFEPSPKTPHFDLKWSNNKTKNSEKKNWPTSSSTLLSCNFRRAWEGKRIRNRKTERFLMGKIFGLLFSGLCFFPGGREGWNSNNFMPCCIIHHIHKIVLEKQSLKSPLITFLSLGRVGRLDTNIQRRPRQTSGASLIAGPESAASSSRGSSFRRVDVNVDASWFMTAPRGFSKRNNDDIDNCNTTYISISYQYHTYIISISYLYHINIIPISYQYHIYVISTS